MVTLPKIVDKNQKKREIALAALDVFAKHGLHKATVDQLAKAAGIGKGTIYLYFQNKEEIVLELFANLFEEHEAWFETHFETFGSETEKIIAYLYLGHIEESRLKKNFALYKEFIAASVTQASPLFREFGCEKFEEHKSWLKASLEKGIQSGEFASIDTELFAEVIIQTKNGAIFSTMERGLGVEHLKDIFPQLLETLLQTITKESK